MNLRAVWPLGLLAMTLAVPSALGQDIHKESANLYSTEELAATVEKVKGDRLTIKSALALTGLLTISTEESSDISVLYFKKAKSRSRSMAIDYIDLITVAIKQTPKGVMLSLRAPNPAPWSGPEESGIVEMEVTVPKGTFIEIDAPYLDIDAWGPLSGLVVLSSLGRLNVTNVDGRLELVTANRRVSIKQITGVVSVSTTNSTLEASDIISIDQQARFTNEGGDIRITGFKGLLNVSNRYGRIDISEISIGAGRNLIRSFSGPILIEIDDMDDGQLVVLNRFEDIELIVPHDISASFSLAVEEDGRIEATNFNFVTDLVQYNRLNITSRSGDARIKSAIRGTGNIYITGEQR